MFTTITREVHVLKYYNLPIPWTEWNHPKSNISYHRVHRLPGLPYSHLPRIAKGCHHHFTRAVERPGHMSAHGLRYPELPVGLIDLHACLDLLRWVSWWVWFSHGPHVQQIPTCHFLFLCFCDFLGNFVGSSVSVLGLHGPRQQHKWKSARVKWVKRKHTPIYFDAVWKNATKSVWKQIWEGNSGICKQNSNYNHLTVVSYAKEKSIIDVSPKKYSQVCWNILQQWHATHINSWDWYLQLATKLSKCSIYCCKKFSQGCWSSKVQSAALAEVRYT